MKREKERVRETETLETKSFVGEVDVEDEDEEEARYL